MKFYVAPMEGVTGFVYRREHARLFPGADAYYAPFIQPKQTHCLETAEKKNIDPANNAGLVMVPQIMANRAELFNWAAQELRARGYSHVNLNLGCPRSTMVTRHKGSGMLQDLATLEAMLDGIFDEASRTGIKISIKTRLGMENFEPAPALMALYDRYPLELLIIHPRTRKDMYKGAPNLDVFESCVRATRHRVCYNGNILCREDYVKFIERFPESRYPQIESMMLGRGLIADPALIREIGGGKRMGLQEYRAYHDALYAAYDALNYGPSALLHRMSELWFYMGARLEVPEKWVHRIRISKTCEEYEAEVKKLFAAKPKIRERVGNEAWN